MREAFGGEKSRRLEWDPSISPLSWETACTITKRVRASQLIKQRVGAFETGLKV